MMQKTITIPLEQYKCLRGHLDQAFKIFESLGTEQRGKASERVSSSSKPRETKQQGINKYKELIETGGRAKKPKYLKK